ncbi:class Ia ribonucleoside-diphosphate reductase subunit beta [Vibrio breoganii]
MSFSVFRKEKNDATKEPMVFGNSVNIARYDQQKHEFLERLIVKQMSFFWQPQEIGLTQDRVDYEGLTEAEKHIFVSNLKYQTLLDSIQGRAPVIAFTPIASTSEMETWTLNWSFSESIHSRSYTHILRSIFDHPEDVLDSIVEDEEILKRAADISHYYDDFITARDWYLMLGEGEHQINGETLVVSKRELLKKYYLCMASVNALEGVRFYLSFVCSFQFAEREESLLSGVSRIIKLIVRDETLHLSFTQFAMLDFMNGGDDPVTADIAKECRDEVIEIYRTVAQQEKDWADFLFSKGSVLGLNANILKKFVEYITNVRMSAIRLPLIFDPSIENPLPWLVNWVSSESIQVAPQEAEIISYLQGAVDTSVSGDDLGELGDLLD